MDFQQGEERTGSTNLTDQSQTKLKLTIPRWKLKHQTMFDAGNDKNNVTENF